MEKNCGAVEFSIFTSALFAGSISSIASKVLLSMRAEGISGEEEDFSYPLFQTFAMFVGMVAGILVHWLVLLFRIPFPGYSHTIESGSKLQSQEQKTKFCSCCFPDSAIEDFPDDSLHAYVNEEQQQVQQLHHPIAVDREHVPMWVYFFLIVPSIFDLVATTLCMYGLRYLNVSVFQILRGSVLIFTAIAKQIVFKEPLKKFMWVGMVIMVGAIVLVGATAMLAEADAAAGGLSINASPSGSKSLVGVLLVLSGAVVHSMQFVFEERVMMSMTAEGGKKIPPVPPLLLVGMEGFWGIVLCSLVLFPLAYLIPGSDHGSLEHPINALIILSNSVKIQLTLAVYIVFTLIFNTLACLVTYMLDAVWHAILDNFRPITVWMLDVALYYAVSSHFLPVGERWDTPWSWLQVVGMAMLLYGTEVYNAPNPGSILLTGSAKSFFIDCTREYAAMLEDDDAKDIILGATAPRAAAGRYRDSSVPMTTEETLRAVAEKLYAGIPGNQMSLRSESGASGRGSTPNLNMYKKPVYFTMSPFMSPGGLTSITDIRPSNLGLTEEQRGLIRRKLRAEEEENYSFTPLFAAKQHSTAGAGASYYPRELQYRTSSTDDGGILSGSNRASNRQKRIIKTSNSSSAIQSLEVEFGEASGSLPGSSKKDSNR